MLASRLLSILMLLQARGRLSAQALADALEVSLRTIYRDIDQLSAAGVPVYAERGRLGGFQLQEGWRTRLTGMTPAEAQALFLAGLPGPAAELGLGEAMASAQLKVLAALPAGWEADAQRVSSRFHLDPVDWFRQAAPSDHLAEVAAAVWNEQRLKLRYESWNGVVERELEPLGLVLKAGVWYLVARESEGEPRTYRVGSILSLQRLAAGFKRTRRFELADYWRESTARFEAGVYQGEATLKVSARGLKLLGRMAPAVAEAAARSAGAEDAQGWRRVTIPIESVEHAANDLLKLGADARAEKPAALRRRLAALTRAMAALYDTM